MDSRLIWPGLGLRIRRFFLLRRFLSLSILRCAMRARISSVFCLLVSRRCCLTLDNVDAQGSLSGSGTMYGGSYGFGVATGKFSDVLDSSECFARVWVAGLRTDDSFYSSNFQYHPPVVLQPSLLLATIETVANLSEVVSRSHALPVLDSPITR